MQEIEEVAAFAACAACAAVYDHAVSSGLYNKLAKVHSVIKPVVNL